MTDLEHDLVDASLARAGAYERQGGYCLACSAPMRPDAFEAHHRVRRAVLGWCRCNVIALHPRCHTQGPAAVHSHPAEAKRLGYIVEPWADPRTVPVLSWWPWPRTWGLLGCDGTIRTTTPPEGAEP